jgi:hypothetical protein
MGWLPSALARNLDFHSPVDVPPTKFTFDDDWVNKWRAKVQFTPDGNFLSQQAYQPFFVYDRLMEGYEEHGKISELVVPLTQIGFTVSRFNHWRKNLGKLSFPIALSTTDKPGNPPWADLVRETSWFKDAPPAIIRGIVYSIRSESFYELDRLYRNGVQFERKKVKISIPYRAKKENGGAAYNLKLWCWMYVGKPDYWEDQLNNMFFSPVPIVEQHPISTVSDYSFFLEPTGEPPQEEQPVVLKKLVQKPYPLLENGRVVGSGFEHVWEEISQEPNPYHNQIDGASSVQRTINNET